MCGGPTLLNEAAPISGIRQSFWIAIFWIAMGFSLFFFLFFWMAIGVAFFSFTLVRYGFRDFGTDTQLSTCNQPLS